MPGKAKTTVEWETAADDIGRHWAERVSADTSLWERPFVDVWIERRPMSLATLSSQDPLETTRLEQIAMDAAAKRWSELQTE